MADDATGSVDAAQKAEGCLTLGYGKIDRPLGLELAGFAGSTRFWILALRVRLRLRHSLSLSLPGDVSGAYNNLQVGRG